MPNQRRVGQALTSLADLIRDRIRFQWQDDARRRSEAEMARRQELAQEATDRRQKELADIQHGQQLETSAVGNPLTAERMTRAGMKLPGVDVTKLGRTDAQRVAPIAGDISKMKLAEDITNPDIINRAEYEGELPDARGIAFGGGKIPIAVPKRPEIAQLLRQRAAKAEAIKAGDIDAAMAQPHEGPQGAQRVVGGQTFMVPKPQPSDEEQAYGISDPKARKNRLDFHRAWSRDPNAGGQTGPIRVPPRLVHPDPEIQGVIDAVRRMSFGTVEETARQIMNVQDAISRGDTESAKAFLKDIGYQQLRGGKLTDYDTYENSIDSMETALAELDPAIPNGVWASLKQAIKPWVGMKRDPRYVDLRAQIELGQAQLKKGFYGTAVTNTEASNAKNFLIGDDDTVETMAVKLRRGSKFLQFVNDSTIARQTNMKKPVLANYIGFAVDRPMQDGTVRRFYFDTKEAADKARGK